MENHVCFQQTYTHTLCASVFCNSFFNCVARPFSYIVDVSIKKFLSLNVRFPSISFHKWRRVFFAIFSTSLKVHDIDFPFRACKSTKKKEKKNSVCVLFSFQREFFVNCFGWDNFVFTTFLFKWEVMCVMSSMPTLNTFPIISLIFFTSFYSHFDGLCSWHAIASHSAESIKKL